MKRIAMGVQQPADLEKSHLQIETFKMRLPRAYLLFEAAVL
jgi:hypothetical protein